MTYSYVYCSRCLTNVGRGMIREIKETKRGLFGEELITCRCPLCGGMINQQEVRTYERR